MTYAEATHELEQILTTLRGPAVEVDGLAERVARAAELIQWCQNRLRSLEDKLPKLSPDQAFPNQ